MANMSYCRFENTLRNLRDCAGYLEGGEEPEGYDDRGPIDRLSDEERQAFVQLVLLCGEIHQGFGEEARRG